MSNDTTTNMQKLNETLFGPNGLGASNVKVTLGHGENITPEDVAGELNKALAELVDGNYDIIAEVGN